ncbi:unnamed protein product [Calicophoron daubneyi]
MHNAEGDPGSTPMLRSLIVCLGRTLRAQSFESWSTDSVRHVYRCLLRYVGNENHAVRKSAHSAVIDILGVYSGDGSCERSVFHPACHQTRESLSSLIEREMKQLVSALHTNNTHCTKLLHCLELFSSILHLFPAKEVKPACECILELTNFPNLMVSSKAFDAVCKLFKNQPPVECLPVDLSARLLTALHSRRPMDPAVLSTPSTSSTDFTALNVMISWIEVVRAGCSRLCELATSSTDVLPTGVQTNIAPSVDGITMQRLASEHLDRLMKILLDLLVSTPLIQLKRIVSNTLDSIMINEVDELLTAGPLCDTCQAILLDMASRLNNCLALQRFETWQFSLVLTARLLRVWPRVCEPFEIDQRLCDLIKNVAKLRDSLVDGPESLTSLIQVNLQNASLLDTKLGDIVIDEMDRVCLVALETLGPELVLDSGLLPLEPIVRELEDGAVELRRSWILPLLARASPSRSCRLRFFVHHILPLADRCLAVVSAAALGDKSANSLITAGLTVARQLWASLSMFVRKPPLDWSELSSGGFGRRMVKELTNAAALRPIILHAFRRLALAAQNDEVALSAMRGGAKLSIPAMLSLYENANDTPTGNALRQQIRATLSAYLPCLSPKTIVSPVKLAFQKLGSTENAVYMDILQILIPHTSSDEIATFLPKMEFYLSHSNPPSRVLQKRAYRLIELVCAGTTEPSRNYLDAHFTELLELLHRLMSPPGTAQTKPDAVPPGEGMDTDDAGGLERYMASLSFIPNPMPHRCKTQKGPKKVPWKPRIRCLYHLLNHLCNKNSLDREEQHSSGNQPTEQMEARLREFANMFLPEILASVCEVNSVVRNLSVKLLIRLTLAFAGETPHEVRSLSSSSLSLSEDAFDSKVTELNNYRSGATDDSHSDKEESPGDGISSVGGLTCGDEVDEIVSTRSMPRGGVTSRKICRALNLVISRLWGFLPPHAAVASNPSELATQEAAGRVVCHLLKHVRFRRALAFCLDSESDEYQTLAASTLSEAGLTAQHLVSAAHRSLARIGLQLIRLLIAFVGFGSVALTDLIKALQSLHTTQKRPLRFAVKTVLEKMIRKFGRQTIQGMTSMDYLKVVRNSARVMARREKRLSSHDTIRGADEKPSGGALCMDSRASTASLETKTLSGRSNLTLPTRVHMPLFKDLLASSDDDDDEIYHRVRPGANSVRSKKSDRRSQKCGQLNGTDRPRSLVEDLESVAETAGLCRKSRKRVLNNENTSSEDEDFDEPLVNRKTGRRVRFADTLVTASTRQRNPKLRRVTQTPTNVSDLWLVENPDTAEVVDLSDPQSLARHTAMAADAKTAKALTNASRCTKRHGSSERSLPFPVVDGKIVIDDLKTSLAKPSTTQDDWSVHSDDDETQPNLQWGEQNFKTGRKNKSSKPKIPGQIYSSTKAAGDMRRSGEPDPYAYISLGAGLVDVGRLGKGTTSIERRRLLRAVGLGKRNRSKMRRVERITNGASRKKSAADPDRGIGIRRKVSRVRR